MLCYAMLCYAMLCYAMLCYAMLYYTILCYAIRSYPILSYYILCYAILSYPLPCLTLSLQRKTLSLQMLVDQIKVNPRYVYHFRNLTVYDPPIWCCHRGYRLLSLEPQTQQRQWRCGTPTPLHCLALHYTIPFSLTPHYSSLLRWLRCTVLKCEKSQNYPPP